MVAELLVSTPVGLHSTQQKHTLQTSRPIVPNSLLMVCYTDAGGFRCTCLTTSSLRAMYSVCKLMRAVIACFAPSNHISITYTTDAATGQKCITGEFFNRTRRLQSSWSQCYCAGPMLICSGALQQTLSSGGSQVCGLYRTLVDSTMG